MMTTGECGSSKTETREARCGRLVDESKRRSRFQRPPTTWGRCAGWFLAALTLGPGMTLGAIDTVSINCDSYVGTNKKFECRVVYVTESGAQGGLAGYRDVRIKATFVNGAETRTTYAAWDGETADGMRVEYVFRMSFPTPSGWVWSLHCESGPCSGVNAATGNVGVLGSGPPNLLYVHGLPSPQEYSWQDSLTGQTRHWVGLVHGRSPGSRTFPWIGDSAWAAPIRTTPTNPTWIDYLEDRAEKGFTVIHLGPAPYWAFPEGDNEAEAFENDESWNCTPNRDEEVEPKDCSRPRLSFWRNFEGLVKSINDHGMVAFVAGVMEPTGSRRQSDPDDPGAPDWVDPVTGEQDVDHEDNYDEDRYPRIARARTFARFLAARLAGNMVVLSPSFDSRPFQQAHNGETVEQLMKAVGSEIAAATPHLPVTNHFGQNAGATEMMRIQSESWLDFQMLQSGAWLGKGEGEQLGWVLGTARTKPPAILALQPRRGALNAEATYDEGEPLVNEGGRTYHRNAYRAREAMYLTWLNGSFGHSLGVGGVWDWNVCSLPLGQQPVHCDKYRNRNNNWDQVTDMLNGDPGARALSSAAMGFWGEQLRSVGPADGAPFLTPFEQSRIIADLNPGEPDLCEHPGEPFQMALGRDPETLVFYMPQNRVLCLDPTNLVAGPGGLTWVDPRTGSDISSSGPILRCPNWPAPPCTIDLVWCQNPPQGDTCYWCNASSPPTLCAFENPLHGEALGNEDVLLKVSAQLPGYAEGWAGASAKFLRAWAGRSEPEGPWGIDGEILKLDGSGGSTTFAISDGAQERFPIHPQVGADGKGTYLVAWQDDSDGDGDSEIHARFVGSDGPVGAEVIVSEGGGGLVSDDVAATTAMDAAGKALVAWTARGYDEGMSPSMLRVAAFDGKFWKSPMTLLTGTEIARWNPRLAARADGRFALAWVERVGEEGDPSVQLQWLDGAGRELTSPVQVNELPAEILRLARAWIGTDGDVRIEWETLGHPDGDGRFVRIFLTTGSPKTDETRLFFTVSDPPVESPEDPEGEPIWE